MEITLIRPKRQLSSYIKLRDGKIVPRSELDRDIEKLMSPLRDDVRELISGTKKAIEATCSNMKQYQRGIKFIAMTTMVFLSFGFKTYAANNKAIDNCFDGIEKAAYLIMTGLQRLAFIISVTACIFQILGAIVQGNPKDIVGLIIKYGIALIAIYTVEPIYALIRDCFRNGAS